MAAGRARRRGNGDQARAGDLHPVSLVHRPAPRRRIAAATFAVVSLAGAIVTPGDSRTFWTTRVFDNSRVGDLGYVANQSLNGVFVRAFGGHEQVVWLVAAAVVVGFGLRRAVGASLGGNEMLGVALVALVGLLVSPVSWIHHLVWVVPWWLSSWATGRTGGASRSRPRRPRCSRCGCLISPAASRRVGTSDGSRR